MTTTSADIIRVNTTQANLLAGLRAGQWGNATDTKCVIIRDDIAGVSGFTSASTAGSEFEYTSAVTFSDTIITSAINGYSGVVAIGAETSITNTAGEITLDATVGDIVLTATNDVIVTATNDLYTSADGTVYIHGEDTGNASDIVLNSGISLSTGSGGITFDPSGSSYMLMDADVLLSAYDVDIIASNDIVLDSTGDVNVSGTLVKHDDTILGSNGHIDLGTGAENFGVSVSSPDDVRGKNVVEISPTGASDDSYTLTMDDNQLIFVVNTGSFTGLLETGGGTVTIPSNKGFVCLNYGDTLYGNA